MTSLSENKQENDVNIDSKQCTTDNTQSSLQSDTSIAENTLTQGYVKPNATRSI